MFVKPAPWPDDPTKLMRVRDPHTGVVMPESGRHIPEGDLHWHRLMLQGDIVEAEAPVETPAVEPSEPANQE